MCGTLKERPRDKECRERALGPDTESGGKVPGPDTDPDAETKRALGPDTESAGARHRQRESGGSSSSSSTSMSLDLLHMAKIIHIERTCSLTADDTVCILIRI